MVEGPLKGQDAKKKKAKVTSTPFDPSAWSERTRVVADGSYLDLSRPMGTLDVRTHMTTKDEKKKAGHSMHGGKVHLDMFCLTFVLLSRICNQESLF